jgi:ABC-2 type transport system permease protein
MMKKRLRRIGAIIQKEMIQTLRDRRVLFIVLFLPAIELLLFAYAIDLTVDHIPTAVADMSLDASSRAFVEALVVSGYFDVTTSVASEAEVIRTIDAGRVKAGVVIPPDFAAQVERGGAQALIILDGSDSFTIQSGYSAAAAIAQDHSVKLLAEKMQGRGGISLDSPVTSSTRVLYNPNLDDMIFLVPGLAAILLQVITIGLVAQAVVRERELGTIEQILVTPARPLELMIGKIVPNVLLASFNLLTIILAGTLLFGVPFRGDPWIFAWLSLVFIVSGLGMGLVISTLASTQKQAQQVTTMVMLLSLLLTGFIYPRSQMPKPVQWVGNLIPMTYYVRIARGIITKGVGLGFVWGDVVALATYGGLAMVLASLTFRRRLD